MINYNTDISYLYAEKYYSSVSLINDFSRMPRPYHIFAYLINGSAQFTTDSNSISINSNDILYIPKGTTYRSVWKGSPDICWISLFFNICRESEIFSGRKCNLQMMHADSESLFDFEFICNNRKDKPLSSVGRFYCLFEGLLKKMVFSDVPVPDERVLAAITHIRKNFAAPISADELAEVSHMSIPNLYRLFKAATGTSPIQYKNQLCIDAASEMLADNPDMKIEVISDALGFASSSYFRRTFKQFTGKTPREYRRICRYI